MKLAADQTPKKVLIVEDEALVALEIQKNLEKNGFDVVSNIAYGEKVLDEINQHNPDVVLMDIKLKGKISGLTAAQIVNKEKDIPIIFLTAYSDAHTIKKVKEVGAYGYIVKPFHDQELKVALEMGLYKFYSERKARINERCLLQFSNQIEDAFIISDKSGKKIFFASKGFEKVFGRDQEQFIQNSESFLDLIHEEDVERFKEFQSSGGESSSLEVEYRILLPDGSVRWVVTRSFPVEKDDFEDRNVIATVSSDITRKKQTEINFKNQIDFIGDQLILKNLDLRLKENKIQDLLKEKREVLSNVSHEFRTPLNAIMGYGQLLENDSLNNWTFEQKEHLNSILKAGHNLLNLIEKVLGFSKVDSRDIPVSIESVHLNPLISDLVNQYGPRAMKKNITIANMISNDKEFFILGDQLLLKQVFMNLISNAIKFTAPEGTVEIHSEINIEKFVRVAVIDTGCGIPQDKHEVIFDPFIRVGEDLYNSENCGLGLAVTRSLLEQMNGTISVDSELDVGSRFSVELPLDKVF